MWRRSKKEGIAYLLGVSERELRRDIERSEKINIGEEDGF